MTWHRHYQTLNSHPNQFPVKCQLCTPSRNILLFEAKDGRQLICCQYIVLSSCYIIPSSVLCAYAVCPKCLLTIRDNPTWFTPKINLVYKILRHLMQKVRPAEGSQVHTKSSISPAEQPQELSEMGLSSFCTESPQDDSCSLIKVWASQQLQPPSLPPPQQAGQHTHSQTWRRRFAAWCVWCS